MKQKQIDLEMILARMIKGYAFRRYPVDGFESAQAYREHYKGELEKDFRALSETEFRAKYGMYIY